jgi:hypothetical protein
VLVHARPVLGDEHHLSGGAAHLGEAVRERIDAVLALGAGDLDVGGEGAAEADGETADDHQQRDPGADDPPAQRGHEAAETVQGRGHATSRTSSAQGRRTTPLETSLHSIQKCIGAILSVAPHASQTSPAREAPLIPRPPEEP